MTRTPFHDAFLRLLRDAHTPQDVQRQKLLLVKRHGLARIPSDAEILRHATPEERAAIRHRTKPVRTQAGVAPIAIMSKPVPCPHGACTFCPDHVKEGIPMSYTGKEPATMRGLRWDFDAYFQVYNRLEQYVLNGHSPQKCEVIIMGGTFPSYPLTYQESFVADIFAALNDFGERFFPGGAFDAAAFHTFFSLDTDKEHPARHEHIRARMLACKESRSRSLVTEQARNEHAFCRCVGLTFETRPDCGLLPHGNLMLRLGGTRVELGVQSVYDACLSATHRAHSSETSRQSIQVLRDLGFKLNFHLMPGLPGRDGRRISFAEDLAGMRQIFSDPEYRPDMVKFYPCMVMPGTPLEQDFLRGQFSPMETTEATKLLNALLPEVPEWVRVMRVQRDIPTYRISAGVDRTNLRQLVTAPSRDIRAREVRDTPVRPEDVQILVRSYAASGGAEYFLSAEDVSQDVLLGFCRLRFPGQFLRPEIVPGTALIRELHVYGVSTPLSVDGETQHRGWGSRLLREAEQLARSQGKTKMVVIAGVGVRQYYVQKHGYAHDGPYVSKAL